MNVMWTTMKISLVFLALLTCAATLRPVHAIDLDVCQIRPDIVPPDRCNKPCVDDSDCTSRRKSCRCDGICGRSCVRTDKQCEDLPGLRRGVVEMYHKMFGAVAEYKCDPGYQLVGNTHRVCQGNEKWSGVEPECIKTGVITDPSSKMCDPPPDIPYARHDQPPGQEVPSATLVRYTCVSGYYTAPGAITEFWCNSGIWIAPQDFSCYRVSCPRLEDIMNGYVSQEAISYPGNNATYACVSGFELAGHYTRLCNYLGQWEGSPPTCDKVTCIEPPVVENAHHDGDQQRYPPGHVLKYECDNGYYSDRQSQAACTGSGYWQGPAVICSPVKCPRPEEVENGWWSGHVYTFPHSVTYTCHKGYELRGDATIKCKDTGRWSDKAPYCEPVTCPPLQPPANGKIIGGGYTFGTNVTIECNPSYRLIGSWTRRCEADRQWSGEPSGCHEIACRLPVFYNGHIISNNRFNPLQENGTTITFMCSPDTAMDESGSVSAVCLESGTWSVPAPICWGMCHMPDVKNGTIVDQYRYQKHRHNTILPYRCNEGMDAGPPLVCYNGTWSDAHCIPAPCKEFPPHVQNGMRVFVSQKHGSQAKYQCQAGYRFWGLHNMTTVYLTCEFGRWTGRTPYCEEIYCDNPGTIENGQVYKKVTGGRFIFKPYIRTIRHGDRLEYECNKGFRLNGPCGATCVNGEWQPLPLLHRPLCVKATHPPFRSLWQSISNMHQ